MINTVCALLGRTLRGSRLAAVALGAALAMGACYPGEVTETSQLDVVATIYNVDAAWGTYQTYAMPDTIVHLVTEDEDTLPITREFDDEILAKVASEMQALGYTRIDVPDQGDPLPADTPDVVLFVSVTASENWVAWASYPWWGYWGWWYGWGWWGGYPGWGWGYPCCASVGVAEYDVGTAFIQMVDINNPIEEDSIFPNLWVAAINGLLSASSTTNATRVMNGIEQAFAQSPYLEPN